MLLVAFIRWWYGDGWVRTIKKSKSSLVGLAQSYSILILLKTLFAPWKQINAGNPANMAIGDRFRQLLDKLISRFVGFMVRSLTLLAAGVSLLVMLILRIVFIIVWPLLPLMVPLLVIYSLGVVK